MKQHCRDKHSWSVDQIRQWVEIDRKTLKWVSEQLGCCVSTIQSYCKENYVKPKMGVPSLDWPVQEIRQWIEKEGKTQKWVAEQIGCISPQVSKICKRHGIKTQRTGPRRGENHTGWKGGRILVGGYFYIYAPEHPNCTKGRYVAEHRLVMEKKIGRHLLKKEVVHHIDGIRGNNEPENLFLFRSNADHLKSELKGRVPNWSPEGYQKMLEAAQRKTIRAKLKHDGNQHNQERHR